MTIVISSNCQLISLTTSCYVHRCTCRYVGSVCCDHAVYICTYVDSILCPSQLLTYIIHTDMCAGGRARGEVTVSTAQQDHKMFDTRANKNCMCFPISKRGWSLGTLSKVKCCIEMLVWFMVMKYACNSNLYIMQHTYTHHPTHVM